jgi:hypothetical protein
MRRLVPCVLLLALAAGTAAARQRQLVDRVVAAVNGQAILASEWDEAVRYEAFLEMRPLQAVSEPERQGALQRLIDQKLLRQQMTESAFIGTASEPEVQRQAQELRRQHPAGGSEQEWQAALAAYELTEQQVLMQLRSSLDALLFIDLRLRPSVHIEREEVESYYRQTLVPELQRSGQQPEPFSQVAAHIEELLVQQRMNQMFDSWLRSLREQSEIRVR